MGHDARAFWVRSPGVGEIRSMILPEPAPDQVLVRTLYTGISRGTEVLVFRGNVPIGPLTSSRLPTWWPCPTECRRRARCWPGL